MVAATIRPLIRALSSGAVLLAWLQFCFLAPLGDEAVEMVRFFEAIALVTVHSLPK